MNEIVNEILIVRDKLMYEMYLRQPESTCSAYAPFTKNKKRMQFK